MTHFEPPAQPAGPANPVIDWTALEQAARRARANAYAPYSRYHVGAAVLADDGQIYAGCNVENATYGLTVCAERTAIVSMIAAGARRLLAAVVVTRGPHIGSPCGACRQVLGEFCEDAPVKLIAIEDLNGDVKSGQVMAARMTSVDALLPERFKGELVLGKEGNTL